jgi:2,4-diketo-3-deoxy-L-fuconate hydrolase
MKLVRFGERGGERPGILDPKGRVRDLSAFANDITPELLSPEGLQNLRSIDPAALPLVPEGVRLGVPVAGIRDIFAIGLNYRDHAAEAGMALPTEPVLFSKATGALSGPNDPVVLPPGALKGDWEVELALVIGRGAFQVSEEDALSHVAGYLVCNDVSERTFQLEQGGQWIKGKSADSFCPLGPWLVTSDDIPDPQDLDLWLDLNGQRMQTGNTRNMVFSVAFLISYVSRFLTLKPGDVITTGTPAGVGLKSGRFLRPGDVMHLGVEGLGEQRQTVSAYSP